MRAVTAQPVGEPGAMPVARGRYVPLLVGGTAVVLVLAELARRVDGVAGAVAQLAAAVGFAVAWLLLNRHDVAALWATVRGRGTTPAST